MKSRPQICGDFMSLLIYQTKFRQIFTYEDVHYSVIYNSIQFKQSEYSTPATGKGRDKGHGGVKSEVGWGWNPSKPTDTSE